jgi:hypothetical protein
MDICQHGKRVVSKLFDMHENLKNERAQIGTTISNEILKCKLEVAEYKAKMDVAILILKCNYKCRRINSIQKRRSIGSP